MMEKINNNEIIKPENNPDKNEGNKNDLPPSLSGGGLDSHPIRGDIGLEGLGPAKDFKAVDIAKGKKPKKYFLEIVK